MKVTNVTSYLVDPGVGKNWILVKVDTDQGIHGWGEAYTQADRDESIDAHIKAMARYLEGRSPFEIKNFLLLMYVDFGVRRPSMEFFSARSALEQALWDIVGKAVGQPVYNLLGGPCREAVRVYANGWYHDTQDENDLARKAKETVDLGFDALKFDPFPGPWRDQLTPDEEDEAVRRVAAVREAVGDRVDILVELHRRLAPHTAISIASRLEKYRPYWYEEPVDVENVTALAEVRHHTTLRIVTGETLYTKDQFIPVLAERAADILNPDVCACGILETREIAAVAEAYRVKMSPHNYNSVTVGLASTLQVAALIPDLLIVEYFVNFADTASKVMKRLFDVEDSRIAIPTEPGLGVELDESALAARPGRAFPKRPLEHFYRSK